MHKDGKWAKRILSIQDEKGEWGCFHSLSQFYDAPITTEQALRRQEILGFTMEDVCIQKVVFFMEDCLAGNRFIPDRREKVTDWDVFSDLMLAAWIRRFTKESSLANRVAEQWSLVVTAAFSDGRFDQTRYQIAYQKFLQPKYGRINRLSMFYPVSLLQDTLDEDTERAMIQYLLNCNEGIYYIYDGKLSLLPEEFHNRDASRYLGAIEILAGYSTAKEQLHFVADWLNDNRNENGKWDMGKTVNDKVYFPLSDDWRRASVREADCTERITKLLNRI